MELGFKIWFCSFWYGSSSNLIVLNAWPTCIVRLSINYVHLLFLIFFYCLISITCISKKCNCFLFMIWCWIHMDSFCVHTHGTCPCMWIAVIVHELLCHLGDHDVWLLGCQIYSSYFPLTSTTVVNIIYKYFITFPLLPLLLSMGWSFLCHFTVAVRSDFVSPLFGVYLGICRLNNSFFSMTHQFYKE